jgi:hypothetical protein
MAADVYKLSFHDSSKKPGTVYLNGTVQSSSDYFSYNADKHNYNTKFNGCTYDGISYSTGLKMEGATQITWTSTEKANVTIVQSTWSDKTIKFDGTELAIADASAITGGRVYTIADVEAGDHSVTRGGGESGIFAIIVEGISSDPAALAITTDLADSYEATVGRSVTLSIKASNAQYYQWYKKLQQGDAMIVDATSPSYTFTPKEEGETKFFCRVLGYNDNYVESKLTTVTAVAWKPITKARSWDFTKGGDGTPWASAQAAATSVWGGPDSSKRYNNVNALSEEELSDGTNPLKGLEGIYFTAPATKILLGGKDSSSKCLQTNGNDISALVVGCSAKDKITIRFCASGKDKTVTITSDQMDGTYVSNSTDRTNEKSASVKEAGDVVLNIPNSVRLYEIKVTPYFAVTDFELSNEDVTVEEFENVTVSGKDFTPSNATDKTLNWTSSDEGVATVKDGVITGVKEGKAIITATSVDGPSKTVAVVVTPCAPKNLSVEMTSNSDAKAPKVESGKTYTLTAKVQGYGLTYQWASKATEKGSYANISGATAQTYEATAIELGSKFYKVTVTNAQGSAVAEYEVKTVVPLQAFTIANEDGIGGINYKAIDADEPQVKVCYQLTKADQEIDLIIPDSVEYAGLTYAVTTVGEEAFVNDNTIESLTTTPVLKEIGARAFMFCINLEEVNLADGIETIGDAAFFGCNAFTTFNIPGSVKYVGYKAFAECAGLTDIYYDGTKDQWNALPNIGMAGIAKSVTIHFIDGETENGKGNIVGISNANADEAQKDGKFVENGQIVIYKNGKKFNAAGAEIK